MGTGGAEFLRRLAYPVQSLANAVDGLFLAILRRHHEGIRVCAGHNIQQKSGRRPLICCFPSETGAGEAIRTPDPNLGKVVLYP